MPLSIRLSPGHASAALNQSPQRTKSSSSAAIESAASSGSVNSHDILKGEKAVAISHNGLTYRLQATRLGKLILTK
jgi:hemin uptake protein HemP